MYYVLELYDKDYDSFYPLAYSQSTKKLRESGLLIEQLVRKDMVVNYHYDDKADELIKEPFDSISIRVCDIDETIDMKKVLD